MSNKELSDERIRDLVLVSDVMAGDMRAFDLLFKKYHRRVFRMVHRLVRHDELAEDLVQETFIRVLRSLPAFRGECSFYTWLFRIALNTARRASGSKERRIVLSVAEYPEDALRGLRPDGAETCSGPERALIDKQMLQLLSQAVGELPDNLARVMALRSEEGLSYAAIAARLHCPVGTVRSRLWRAREFLHRRLDPKL
ncbi:RNA polymerase sigma factor [Duganella caerulea]|uniref:sigma-70 family RNA polymerase sigma factor n=1 Tax=Duganella caerulea TaxID=2885762 RepID=UPI0030E7B516